MTVSVNVVTAARLGWAAVLLVAPGRVLSAAGLPADRLTVTVARVLGARHLAQGAVTAFAPTPAITALGTAVDALHTASCLAAAAVSPRWRRAALLDAAVEAVITAGAAGTRGSS